MAFEKTLNTIAIYIATHNEKVETTYEYEIPIQAGAAMSEKRLCEIVDSTGDNISAKNPEYCELTVWYWIWKNDNHSIVGLNHYRRRFELDYEETIQLLDTYDMIVPPPYFFRYSLKIEYGLFHSRKDLKTLLDILHEYQPDLDMEVQSVFNNNCLIPYNMFIAKKEIINEYCSWLFPILFEVEKRLEITAYSTYQKRVFGFLAERLFTLYVSATHLKTYNCSVQIPEKDTIIKAFKLRTGQYYNKLYFGIRKDYE